MKTGDLKFVSPTGPLPSIELDLDSVPPEAFALDSIVADRLAAFASANTKARATVYTYYSQSVSFHEPTSSVFYGVAGSSSVRAAISSALSKVRGARFKDGDEVTVARGSWVFHIQDGKVWRPNDDDGWTEHVPHSSEPAAPQTEPEWDIDLGTSTIQDERSHAEAQTLASQANSPVGIRFRQARSDATIGSIGKTIERVFGLPAGSVALCGPDGKHLRSSAKIATLRKRWE